MGESYSGIHALADFIRDVTKYQHRDEYLSYDPVGKEIEWKSFWFHVGNFESPLPERIASWLSSRPGGSQVKCILGAIAKLKNKGITSDHVVFSFISHRIQPLQHRKHPASDMKAHKIPPYSLKKQWLVLK